MPGLCRVSLLIVLSLGALSCAVERAPSPQLVDIGDGDGDGDGYGDGDGDSGVAEDAAVSDGGLDCAPGTQGPECMDCRAGEYLGNGWHFAPQSVAQ